MVRRDAPKIGAGFDRGTNMHPISLVKDQQINFFAKENIQKSNLSWVIAAIVGACLIGKKNFYFKILRRI